MQLGIVTATFIWPTLIGIALAFQRTPNRFLVAGVAVSIAPLFALMLLYPLVSAQSLPGLSDFSIILVMALIAGTLFYLARRLAQPFSDIWREHRDARVEETFK